MARFTTNGLIHSIRGKLGNIVFYYWKGIPNVRKAPKRVKNPRTKNQVPIMSSFSDFSKCWQYLNSAERALWEEYAKGFSRKKPMSGKMILHQKGRVTGKNAFIGTNVTLKISGLKPIKIPPLGNVPNPPLPATDLKSSSQCSSYIRFKVRLPEPYPYKCVAQIRIKLFKGKGSSRIARNEELSDSPSEVIIDKVQYQRKSLPLREIKNSKVQLYMRTVAQNGKFSMLSQIYTLEIRNGEQPTHLFKGFYDPKKDG